MKFFNLFKKELREMFNANMILSLVVSFVILVLVGQFMQSSIDTVETNNTVINICDMDDTNLTAEIIDRLNSMGYSVNMLDSDNTLTDVEISQQRNGENVLVIPQGFTESIETGETAPIRSIGTVENTAIISQISQIEGSTYTTAISDISSIVKNILIEQISNFDANALEFINSPVFLEEVTVVGDCSEEISASTVNSVILSQGTFIPIIIFIIIVFASQMIVTAISTEKIDKTLETLLSTPISRVSILNAKMLSAGLVSLISALVYMLGFSLSMGSMFSGITDELSEIADSTISTTFAMISLGLTLNPFDYVVIGLDIFLSIMIALSLSMILGVMVNDIKSTQVAMMPIMFMALIPYFASYFVNVNSLSPIAKTILNIIPFMHTFNATSNLMFGNDSSVWLGVIYQIIFLIICMFFAIRLFKSDRILTATITFGKKKS